MYGVLALADLRQSKCSYSGRKMRYLVNAVVARICKQVETLVQSQFLQRPVLGTASIYRTTIVCISARSYTKVEVIQN